MAGIEAFFEDQDPEDTKIEVELEKEPASTLTVEDKGSTVLDSSTTPPIPGTVSPPATDSGTVASPEAEGEIDESTAVVPKEGEVKPPPAEGSGNQIQETLTLMRQLLQEQAQRIAELEGRSTGLTKVLTESGHIDESDLNAPAGEGAVSFEKVELLSILRETMAVNPTYSDLNEVCSQDNYDQTVEALAKLSVKEEGGTLTEQIQNVSKYIWSLPNPYKFVYDIVKANHPKYTTPKEGVIPPVRTPPTPPTSLGKIPGGSPPPAAGWTAAKIDALPEDELHNVPEAVYDKYMQNLLP